jgi:hypothetical protein
VSSTGCCPAIGRRNMPTFASARKDSRASSHHSHWAQRGRRKGPRSVSRGGRLCHQAVLGARVDGASTRAAQTQPTRAVRRTPPRRGPRPRSADSARSARLARHPTWSDGVSAARTHNGTAGSGLFPRAIALRRVAADGEDRRALGRRARGSSEVTAASLVASPPQRPRPKSRPGRRCRNACGHS